MILTALLIGAVAVLAISFWDEIKNWMRSLVAKARKAVKATVIGAKIFLKKMKEAYEEIAKMYQQDSKGQWYETTETKRVSESEVPPEIRQKARVINKEVDISKELEDELKLIL